MAEPQKPPNGKSSKAAKKIKVHKVSSQGKTSGSITGLSSSSSFSSDLSDDKDDSIPISARDSKWVGISFSNPSVYEFDDEKIEEEDEEEIIVSGVDQAQSEIPLYTLFPNLRQKLPPAALTINNVDTTAQITRSLLGEKPDFTVLKKSRRFVSKQQLSLPSLEEQAVEEKETLQSVHDALEGAPGRISSMKRYVLLSASTTSREGYEDDFPTEEHKRKKKRKTKRKTEVSIEAGIESSCSGLNVYCTREFPKLYIGRPPKKKIRTEQSKTSKFDNGSSADNESES